MFRNKTVERGTYASERGLVPQKEALVPQRGALLSQKRHFAFDQPNLCLTKCFVPHILDTRMQHSDTLEDTAREHFG